MPRAVRDAPRKPDLAVKPELRGLHPFGALHVSDGGQPGPVRRLVGRQVPAAHQQDQRAEREALLVRPGNEDQEAGEAVNKACKGFL